MNARNDDGCNYSVNYNFCRSTLQLVHCIMSGRLTLQETFLMTHTPLRKWQ